MCNVHKPARCNLQQLEFWDHNYHWRASWKISINLTHEQDILACVQYKPVGL